MSIVSGECPNCGGSINVNNLEKAGICEYCGKPYIVEEAINHYHITNNITGETVNVYGGDKDFVVRGGVLEKYNGASVNPVVPDGVVEIGKEAFANTRITGISFPAGLKVIAESAFCNCPDLEEMIIPDRIDSIRGGPWPKCSIIFKNKETLDRVLKPGGTRRLFYGAKEVIVEGEKLSAEIHWYSDEIKKIGIGSGENEIKTGEYWVRGKTDNNNSKQIERKKSYSKKNLLKKVFKRKK